MCKELPSLYTFYVFEKELVMRTVGATGNLIDLRKREEEVGQGPTTAYVKGRVEHKSANPQWDSAHPDAFGG